MYQIVYVKKFKKSFAKLVKGGLKKSIQKQIIETIDLLASGAKLPSSYRGHRLHGELSEYCECHVQGDLLLVYQIKDKELILLMVNIGSHNDLF
jgi:mRNA interferase YafQ